MKKVIVAMLLLAVLCACQRGQQLKPQSGGEPYEVVVATTDNELRLIADSLLTTDVVGLPQSEPMFSLSHFQYDRLTQTTRYARNIVRIEKDTTLDRPSVRYYRNRYAKPQLIAEIKTPTAKGLKAIGKRLTTVIERFELEAIAASFDGHRNTDAERRIAEMFDWQLSVPQELTASKQGQGFVWVSDNGKLAMSNLCVYIYKGNKIDVATLIDKRDSIMAQNIPGETPVMHMKAERHYPLTVEKDADGLVCRGLWLMENDAMGGPFVCRAVVDSQKGQIVVAEGFVYAPGRKKRDKLKRMEAAIRTLKRITQ